MAKCPICGKYKDAKQDVLDHIDEVHSADIPNNYSTAMYYYSLNHGGRVTGVCRVCKRPTPWSDKAGIPSQLCGALKCKQTMRIDAENNMIGSYGKKTLLGDADHQKKMLANRKISGTYEWSDGKHKFTYTGSYEKIAIDFIDKVLNLDPDKIQMPGPALPYMYNDIAKFWITDIYLEDFNLIIEIKTGGANPNTHPGFAYNREIEAIKDELMKNQTEFNYIKLTDKNMLPLVDMINKIRARQLADTSSIDEEPLIVINEAGVEGLHKTTVPVYVLLAYDDRLKTFISASLVFDLYLDDIHTKSDAKIIQTAHNDSIFKNQKGILLKYIGDQIDTGRLQSFLAKGVTWINEDIIPDSFNVIKALFAEIGYDMKEPYVTPLSLLTNKDFRVELDIPNINEWDYFTIQETCVIESAAFMVDEYMEALNEDKRKATTYVLCDDGITRTLKTNDPDKFTEPINESVLCVNRNDFSSMKRFNMVIIGEIHNSAMISYYDKALGVLKPDYFIHELAYEDKCLSQKTLKLRMDEAGNGTFKTPCDHQNNYWLYELAYKHNCKLIGCDLDTTSGHSNEEKFKIREEHMLNVLRGHETEKCLVGIGDAHLRSIPWTKELQGIGSSDIVSYSSVVWRHFKDKTNVLIVREPNEYNGELKYLETLNESATNLMTGSHSDVVEIYNSLSKEDKIYIGNTPPKEHKTDIYRKIYKIDGDVAGSVEGTYMPEHRSNTVYLFIMIKAKYRGQGLIKKMTDDARDLLSDYDIRWVADAKNIASNKAAIKAGFTKINYKDDNGQNEYIAKAKPKKPLHESVLNENYILHENDIELNMDDFHNGKNNVVYITGHSGSGKSSLSRAIGAEHKQSVVIELDKFGEPNIDESKPGDRILMEYQKKLKTDETKKDTAVKSEDELVTEWISSFKTFFDWLVNKIESDKSKIYVVEGIQIPYAIDPDFFKNRSMIIKNTSMIKSIYQRFAIRKDQLKFGDVKNMLSYYKYNEQLLTKFKNNIKKHVKPTINESVEILNESIGSYIELFKRTTIVGLVKSKIASISSMFNKVEVVDGIIEIKGIQFRRLMENLKELYEESGLHKIFEPQYKLIDQIMFERKEIRGNKRKIEYFRANEFFALELFKLFEELYAKFNYEPYATVAEQIMEKTWLKNMGDNAVTEELDTSRLSELTHELKPYQLEFIKEYPGMKKRLNMRGYILAFDQGLGKTLTACALSIVLNKDLVYIVCPNSLKENWSYEIKQYFPKYSDDTVWKNEVFIVENSKYKHGPETKFVICNQESIPKMYPFIKDCNSMIIVDESHNFRNLGKRTNDLLKLKDLSKSSDILLMSGTPIKSTPNEIVPALMMIDPLMNEDVASVYNKCFNIEGTLAGNIVKERFSKIMWRKMKDEVLELPMKYIEQMKLTVPNSYKYELRNVRILIATECDKIMTERLKENPTLSKEYCEVIRKYSSANKQLTEDYLKHIVSTTNTGVMIDLHELTQKEYDDFSKLYIYPNIKEPAETARVKALTTNYINMKQSSMGRAIGMVLPKYRCEAFIEMYKQNRDTIIKMIKFNTAKTVIFSSILNVVHYIYDDLEKEGIGIVKVVGGSKNRMEDIMRFKNDDSIDVIIATSQTLSTGVTLTEANQMFVISPPWRSADFDQACDRIYRIGQTSNVHIWNLILDTGKALNVSSRMQQILDWSNDMFSCMINIPDDDTEEALGESVDYTDMEYTQVERYGGITINESTDSTVVYHLSDSNLNNHTLMPRIPDNYMTKNGYEDNKVPRVSFAKTIDGCVMGIVNRSKGKQVFVHVPDSNKEYDIKSVTNDQSPDSSITGEVWIIEPVRLKCIGKIEIIDDAGEDGMSYKYGDKTAELYKWNWKWLSKVNNETLNETAIEEWLEKKAAKTAKKYGKETPLTTKERDEIKTRFGEVKCLFFHTTKGYYCKTQRCRSDFYPTIQDIPLAKVRYVSSTS